MRIGLTVLLFGLVLLLGGCSGSSDNKDSPAQRTGETKKSQDKKPAPSEGS